MRCPKCQFDHELQTTECLRCGIVFSHYQTAEDTRPKEPGPAAVSPATTRAVTPDTVTSVAVIASTIAAISSSLDESTAPANTRSDALRELKCRVMAFPLVLIVARLMVAGGGSRMAAGMLAMVLHESGHAITAWLTGRWAVPMLWVTMHGEDRSWGVVLVVTTVTVAGGFVGWKLQRWGWVCIAGAIFVVQLIFLNGPAGTLIVFGGDGGAMVLGTVLMATFYAPRESKLRRSWGLRWGLLAIGAIAFMCVYRMWSGPFEDIPFGEIEGVNLSDPSLLTQMYGWSVPQLIDRYLLLAHACFVAMGALYFWGMVSAYAEVRILGTPAVTMTQVQAEERQSFS